MLKMYILAMLTIMGFGIGLVYGLNCAHKLESTHPGINGTDMEEMLECRQGIDQCIRAKCTFAEGHVIATGCKQAPKRTCKAARRDCEKAGGELVECSCEPGGECTRAHEGEEDKDEL